MSYCTAQQWSDRYGHYDDHLTAGQVDLMIAEASAMMDQFMARRSLHTKTVTDLRWRHRGGNPQTIYLPDYPPLEPDKWFCRLTALTIYEWDGDVRHTVSDPDTTCKKWVEQTGKVILPSSVDVQDGDIVEASYFCGYGSIAAKPSNTMTSVSPATLRAACLEWTKSLVLTALGQRGEFEMISEAGIAKSKAQEMLLPWRRLAVSGAGAL